jgi:hypothetical protein
MNTQPPWTDAEIELALLRAFYLAWRALHDTPRGPGYRQRAEQAAQHLVEQSDALAGLYDAQAKPKAAPQLVVSN